MNVILKIVRNGTERRIDLTPFFYGAKTENAWEESKHPRDKDGKFSETGGNKNMKESSKEKIDSVRIDFSKDNYLPELGDEVLKEIGAEKSKPVLLKKSIIERNLSQHPEVERDDYVRILKYALYKPEAIFPGNDQKPYFNFISRVEDEKSSVVLLEVAENKENFEIVHLHWAYNRQRKSIERKGERIKAELGRTANPT